MTSDAPSRGPGRIARLVRGRAARADKGARTARAGNVAIEFGIIGSSFLMLLLGTLEVGYYQFSQVALDYATGAAARALLTGSVSVKSGTGQTSFQSVNFCNYLSPLLPCSNVLISLQPVTDFRTALAGASAPTSGTTVNPGGPGSMMLLQAYYTPGLTSWPFNAATIVSSAGFVNEY